METDGMRVELDYRWHLREVMARWRDGAARRGMFSTTDLRPLLAERGVKLSPSQVYRLVVGKPARKRVPGPLPEFGGL
jgi:Cro/C1-type HTH DNA-binding domain